MVHVDEPCCDVRAEGHPRTKFTYSTEPHVNGRFQWWHIWGWLCAPAIFNHFTSQTEIVLLSLGSLKSSFPLVHHHLKSMIIGLKISGGQVWLKWHFLLLRYVLVPIGNECWPLNNSAVCSTPGKAESVAWSAWCCQCQHGAVHCLCGKNDPHQEITNCPT